mmetsp:Transcript_30013/g.63169  ORF Transcript_30013/g.63169 Transcript_30013/m.63169 type:complete len:156 (+) Transcript_30013:133-600(+)
MHFSGWQLYCNRNGGREKFQICLGMDLLNTAIEMGWEDRSKLPQNWMRQGPLVPCNCKEYFFCLNGYTNGIHHKPKQKVIIHHPDGSKTKTQDCTEIQVRLWDSSSYCAQCYRNIKGDALSTKKKKILCRKSTMGCPSCMEPICKPCWDNGYDQH